MSAVTCGRQSLSQIVNGFLKANQINLVHFETRKLVLAFVAACGKTPALSLNLIIQWTEVGCIGHSSFDSDEVKAI